MGTAGDTLTPLESAHHELALYFAANPKYPGGDFIHARCRAVMSVYVERYQANDLKNFSVKAVEELVMAPVMNLNTRKETGYIASGKIDVTLYQKDKKRLSIMDHKILASEFDAHHHEHLLVDTQPLQYSLLKHLNGVKIESAIWDVIAKTSHKPGKATPEEFEERIYKMYSESPDSYFARKEIPIMEYHLAQYANDLHSWTMMVHSARMSDTHLKNPDSCFQYRRACEHLGICSGRVNMESALQSGELIQIETIHPELELPEGSDQNKIITNSRLKKFRACMFRHDLHYNKGIRKTNQVTEEPLFVGSAMHKALEGYWLAIKSSEEQTAA